MTYVRVTRDQRGYETTYLLHTPRPGERTRVLYWYRTAPGIRVGRPALDEEAIRAIEEQHPDIEFDWHHLLDELATAPAEVERRPERPRRRQRSKEEADATPEPFAAVVDAAPESPGEPGVVEEPPRTPVDEPREPARVELAPVSAARPSNPLLDQLVGREIAKRLRVRYAEIDARLRTLPQDEAWSAWRARADALDPDRWSTPEAILAGVQSADRLFDELKRELPGAPGA